MKKLYILITLLLTISIYSQENENTKENQLKEIETIDNIDKTKQVSFKVIEIAPIHPDCKNFNTESERRKCLHISMRKHVQKHFNAELANCIEKRVLYNYKKKKDEEVCIGIAKGKKRIYIQFKINYTGEIIDIKVRAPHPKLKEEGIRIAKLLPKMEPGKQDSVPVRVGYTLPITFNVD
jgi:hypothetical protein